MTFSPVRFIPLRVTPVRSVIITGIAALCCSLAAQGQDSSPGMSPSTTGQSASQTGSSNMRSASNDPASTAQQDKMFLMNSAEGSMAEIALSKMALRKGKSDEVKGYAQQMITDHMKLIGDMKPFADQMGVQPPAKLKPAHQQEAQRLMALSGEKFDKEYITAMVADHHKDLGEFKAEEAATANPDLKTTVSQGEQVIKQHTEMIDAIAQKNSISTPPIPAM